MSNEGKEGRKMFLSLLRVELVDQLGFGFGFGCRRIKDPGRAIVGSFVDCLALFRSDLVGFANDGSRTVELV